jgi:hypothetical protein
MSGINDRQYDADDRKSLVQPRLKKQNKEPGVLAKTSR